MIHFGGHWSESWKCVEVRARWRVYVFVCVCVFKCEPTSFWSYEQMFLCWRLMCKRKIKKPVIFHSSVGLWKVWGPSDPFSEGCFWFELDFSPLFLLRRGIHLGIETSTSLTRTCNQRTFNQTPIHISVVLLICLSTCSSVNSADSELPTWHRP